MEFFGNFFDFNFDFTFLGSFMGLGLIHEVRKDSLKNIRIATNGCRKPNLPNVVEMTKFKRLITEYLKYSGFQIKLVILLLTDYKNRIFVLCEFFYL